MNTNCPSCGESTFDSMAEPTIQEGTEFWECPECGLAFEITIVFVPTSDGDTT